MSRRQAQEPPGILSPQVQFLTPSITASPILQPSQTPVPFQQDVFILSGNLNTQDNEGRALNSRRQSFHHDLKDSSQPGTIIVKQSPTHSPRTVAKPSGVTGVDLNTTLVGSNNIQLNKKAIKRTTTQQNQQPQPQQLKSFQQANNIYSGTGVASVAPPDSGHGQLSNITVNGFAAAGVASNPKSQAKKTFNSASAATALNQQNFQQFHSGSPLTADSPSPGPSNSIIAAAIKPPTPQPLQMLPQQFTITGTMSGISQSNAMGHTSLQRQSQQLPQHIFQLVQGPNGLVGQLVAAPAGMQTTQHQAILQPRVSSDTPLAIPANTKSGKGPQQILPKPQFQEETQQRQYQNSKAKGMNDTASLSGNLFTSSGHMRMPQIVHSPQPQQGQLAITANAESPISIPQPQLQHHQGQIILPTGTSAPGLNTNPQHQHLLVNQLPVILQQNTHQGLQFIIRPSQPLVVQNSRGQPQLQHQSSHQQLIRIVGGNNTPIQLGPAFFMPPHSNIIQQQATSNQLQATMKPSNPANSQITQFSGIQGTLTASPHRSHSFSTAGAINPQLLASGLSSQLQIAPTATPSNNTVTQIQIPNGLSTSSTVLSQLPAQIQQSLCGATINLNQLNSSQIQQIAAAIQAANASPARANNSCGTEIFTHQLPNPLQAPVRQQTPVPQIQQQPQHPQNIKTSEATQTPQRQQASPTGKFQLCTEEQPSQPQTGKLNIPPLSVEVKKKPRVRKKKPSTVPISNTSLSKASTSNTHNESARDYTTAQDQSRDDNKLKSAAVYTGRSSGNDLLANIIKEIGITEDEEENFPTITASSATGTLNEALISYPNQNERDDTSNRLITSTPPQVVNAPTEIDSTDTPNIVIKINTSDYSPITSSNEPQYTISIPRLPSAAEIQHQAQQRFTQQAGENNKPILVPQKETFSMPALPTSTAAPEKLQIPTPNLRDSKYLTTSSTAPNFSINNSLTSTMSPLSTTSNTNSSQKPKRRGPAKRPAKKQDAVEIPVSSAAASTNNTTIPSTAISKIQSTIMIPSLSGSTSIPTSIPSQIGNIQISQVQSNQPLPSVISNTVQNRIQIMPILDNPSSRTTGNMLVNAANSQQPLHQQHHNIILQPHNIVPPVTLSAGNGTISQQHQVSGIIHNPNNLVNLLPHQTAAAQQAAFPLTSTMPATISQLTGKLSVEVSDNKLVIRHDPNLPPGLDSHAILRAISMGCITSLPIVTDQPSANIHAKSTLIQQCNKAESVIGKPGTLLQPTMSSSQSKPQSLVTGNEFENSHSLSGMCMEVQQISVGAGQPLTTTPILSTSALCVQPQQEQNTSESRTSLQQQKFGNLTKMDSPKQLFYMDTTCNQIVPLKAGQTALCPTDRLIIASSNLNAQDIAKSLMEKNDQNRKCLQVGDQPRDGLQNAPRASLASGNKNSSSLITTTACPVSGNSTIATSTTVTRQVANVVPIQNKKKPLRKTKMPTNILKPMLKMDPLSQRPNNNPVQIVQPNIVSGKQITSDAGAAIVFHSTTSSTTAINSAQLFQSLSQQTSGTKLVGVTAPILQSSVVLSNTQRKENVAISPFPNTNNSSNIMSVISSSNSSGSPPQPSSISNMMVSPFNSESIVQTTAVHIIPQQNSSSTSIKNTQLRVSSTSKEHERSTLIICPVQTDKVESEAAFTCTSTASSVQQVFCELKRNSSVTTSPSSKISSCKPNISNIPSNVVQPNNHSMTNLTTRTTKPTEVPQHPTQANSEVGSSLRLQSHKFQNICKEKVDAGSKEKFQQLGQFLQGESRAVYPCNEANLSILDHRILSASGSSVFDKINNSNCNLSEVLNSAEMKTSMPSNKAAANTMSNPLPGLYLANSTRDISTSKPKIARQSLFVRQLEVDHESFLNPDYVEPFKTKEEAVKRLLRLHCAYESDEDTPSDEEETFEAKALELSGKYQFLTNKYKSIMLLESTRLFPKSDLCHLQKLITEDLKEELVKFKNATNTNYGQEAFYIAAQGNQDELNEGTELIMQIEKKGGIDTSNVDIDRFDMLKASVVPNNILPKLKSEYGDPKLFLTKDNEKEKDDLLMWGTSDYGDFEDISNDSTIRKLEPSVKSEPVCKNIGYFDSKGSKPQTIHHAHGIRKSESSSISGQHRECMFSNTTPSELEEAIESLKEDENQAEQVNHLLSKGQQSDNKHHLDWLCLQKELNAISNVEHDLRSSQPRITHKLCDQQTYDIFSNSPSSANDTSNHVSNLFSNRCTSRSDTNTCISNSSCSQQRQQPTVVLPNGESELPGISEFFGSDSDAQKAVESRLDSMFGESPIHVGRKRENVDDEIKSQLDEFFEDSKSSGDVRKHKVGIWQESICNDNFMDSTGDISFRNVQREYGNSQQIMQLQHHIPLENHTEQRWMPHMEAHYPEYIGSDSSEERNKRPWSFIESEGMDESTTSKRSCTTSSSSSPSSVSQKNILTHSHGIGIASTSSTSADMILHDGMSVDQSMPINGALLHVNENYSDLLINHRHHGYNSHQAFENLPTDHIVESNMHIIHQQQSQTREQHHFEHNVQTQQRACNGVSSDEFDESDMHNVIDKLLNLPNNDSESMHFSLDSILEDQRQQIPQLPSCQEEASRNQSLLDDIGQVLLAAGGNVQRRPQQHQHTVTLFNQTDHNGHSQHVSLNEIHDQQQQMHPFHLQQQASAHQPIGDFNCGLNSIDEAVKSIISS